MGLLRLLLDPTTRRIICQAISLTGAVLALLIKTQPRKPKGGYWYY